MAVPESAAASVPPASAVVVPETPSPASGDTTEPRFARVDKPDDDKFRRDLSEAEKQLSAVQDKIVRPLPLPLPPLAW
jgi:hypothetical protein